MKYKYNQDAFKFEREENKNSILLVTKKENLQVVVNHTAKEIIDLLPRFNDTNDIIESISNNYKNVDKRIIEMDSKEIFRLLEIYGVMEIEGESKNGDSHVSMIGDMYYSKVSSFIGHCLKDNNVHYATSVNPSFFEPVRMRARVMQNIEYGALAIKKGKVVAYVSIAADGLRESGVMTITNVFMEKTLGVKEQESWFLEILNFICRQVSGTVKVNKIRFIVIRNGSESKVENKIKKVGFEEECVLRKENNNDDVVYYTLFV